MIGHKMKQQKAGIIIKKQDERQVKAMHRHRIWNELLSDRGKSTEDKKIIRRVVKDVKI